MKIIFIVMILITSFSSWAKENLYFCNDYLESLPIQQNGRVKPLYVHANEAIKELTGHVGYQDLSSVVAYCLLSARGLGLEDNIQLRAVVEHQRVKTFLNLAASEHDISYSALLQSEDAIKMEWRSTKENDSYKKALSKLQRQIGLYKDITQGTNWMLADKPDGQLSWQPLVSYLTEEKVKLAQSAGSIDPFRKVFETSMENYNQFTKNDKIGAELLYSKMQLVQWSLGMTIVSIALLLLLKSATTGHISTIITALIQVTLIGLRVYISGRAPITNMYETVLSSGTGGLILAMILHFFAKDTAYLLIGLIYNVCALLMLNFANGMLSATISPLVPVLRDNFWLSTHVTTVILSYGALALSWVLANYIIIRKWFIFVDREEEKYISEKIYTILKWGTTMLAAGIILGGVWADYSWGRFWGWDPKETWSLIVLCVYMAILHGRYTSWIRETQLFTYTAAAFLSVMMAWFGVNYILATGLHSYGFSEGGAMFLISFFTIQLFILFAGPMVKRLIPVQIK